MLPLVAMAASPTLVQPAARLATGRQVIGPRRSASPAAGKIQLSAAEIAEIHEKARFIEMSGAGASESRAHGVN